MQKHAKKYMKLAQTIKWETPGQWC